MLDLNVSIDNLSISREMTPLTLYNVVNRMYGTFYWTLDISFINTTITMFTTEIEFKVERNNVQFFYVEKNQE